MCRMCKSWPARVAGVFVLWILVSSTSWAQTSPSAYSAYSNTDTKTIPIPPPTLGAANSFIIDPTFGSRILRATDSNTLSGQSFIPTDAGFHRTWNADATAFKLIGPGGQGYWMDFNPNTFQVGTLHSLTFGTTWTWSATQANIIYYLNGNKISTYNKSNGGTADVGGPTNGDPVTYTAVTVGADLWVCSAAGTGVQDSYTKIFCIDPAHGTKKFIDVLGKTINGVNHSGDANWPVGFAGSPACTIGIHSIAGGPGSSWLDVSFHCVNWMTQTDPNYDPNGSAVFNLDTETWSLLRDGNHGGDGYTSGHSALGYNKYANSGGSPNGQDGRGIAIRNPDNLQQVSIVAQPPNTVNWCDSEHNSWFNSASNPDAPVLQSRYYVNTSCPNFAWNGEIIAAAVDGSNTVWRFAHNHSVWRAGVCTYYGDAFAQISNDGKWALFSSPWEGTLGSETGGFGCGTRIDTFIVELLPATGPFTLTVSPPTNGSITSTDTPQTINCGSTCSHSYPGTPQFTQVTLTATPAAGYVFNSWGGACAGVQGSSCTVTMDANKTASATFNSSTGGTYNLTVTAPTNGTITSGDNPQTINCGATCAHDYTAQTQVTLTANPNVGYVFGSWGGSCAGTSGASCTLTMNAAKTASVTFNSSPGGTVYTDDFNRANNTTVGSSWIEKEDVAGFCTTALQIVQNMLYTSQCHGAFTYWNNSFANDQYSKLQYKSWDANAADKGGPAVRINTAGDWNNATMYMAEYERATATVRLRKYVGQALNTTGTQLGSDVVLSPALAVGDWLEIRAQGSTITVLVNGVAKITATDSSIASGSAGAAVRSSGSPGGLGWDSWEGGNLVISAYTDDFNRANSTAVGSSWTEKEDVAGFCTNALQIVQNMLYTSQCHGGFAYWNNTYSNDQYSKLQYKAWDANSADKGGPAVRINTAGDWNNATMYMAEYERATATIRLRKYVNQALNTTGTQLGSDVVLSPALAVGDWLEIRAQGSTITVLVNGVAKITSTDTAIASGNAGAAVRSSGSPGGLGWDNWASGNLAPSAYTDDFNRANTREIGASWIEKEDVAGWCDTALQIIANRLYTSQCHGAFAYWNSTFSNDQYSKLQYGAWDGNAADKGGPAVRINASGDWNNATMYMVEYERATATLRLRKYVNQALNTTGTQLGSDVVLSPALAVGDWVEIRAQGSTITVLVNGIAKITVTDTSITTGKAGTAVRSSGSPGGLGWDNWEAGTP
jgi:hypothetical protein